MKKLLIDDWGKWLDFTGGGIFQAAFGGDWLKFEVPPKMMKACYGANYTNPITERYIAMLKEFTGYEAVALFTTGAEATEAFWRACRVYTGKPGVWGGLVDPDEVGNTDPAPKPDAMHGVTMGALIMAGKMRLPNRGMFLELGADFEGKTHEATACAIWEPYHAPSAQFHREIPTMDRIRANIKAVPDIPFCCDEVQGGFGRTGKLFAHQWYSPEIKSEFVCLGKLLGGGLPLSALLGPRDILEDPMVQEYAHLHSTHSGHPVMCAAGIEVIQRIQAEGLIERSYEKGLLLADLLKAIGVKHHAGRGLLAALEFDGPVMAQKVVEACQRRGLLVCDTGRKWVKIGPALNITDEQICKGCQILSDAITEVQEWKEAVNHEVEAQRGTGEGFGSGGAELPEAGVQAGGSGGVSSGPEDAGQPR